MYFVCFVTAKPNEWLLVMRNGRVVCSGVGASYYVMPGDQVVKFPSKINRFKFSASQITEEKQGIEVEGVLVWSVFRENDGPLRAYKFLGDDLKADVPVNANDTLKEMSNSIVRHRIANSTIDDILKKRDEIRNEIRREMQVIVNGWGVWLESVEITDVRILSSSLFQNLQTEFREEQRQKAEIIKINTDAQLEQRRMQRQLEKEYQQVENKSKQQVFAANEALKVQQEKQKVLEKEHEIEALRVNADKLLKKHKQTADNEIAVHAEQIAQANTLARIEREKEEVLKQRELLLLKEETEKIDLQHALDRKTMQEQQQRDADELQGTMRNKLLQSLDYKLAALNAAKEIYSNLAIKELKMVNMSQDGANDGIMQLVNRLITGGQAVTN